MAGAIIAAIAVTGCGAAHQMRQPTARTSSVDEHAAGVQIVVLPQLGVLSYRCDRAQEIEVTLDARTVSATESATVEGNDGRHLRLATLNPGAEQITAPLARYTALTWRVIQSTEPETLEATVRLRFHPGKNAFACSLTSWNSTINVIGHQGAWSVPHAWP